MTGGEFLAWAQTQGARYEFDGFRPVATTGASVNHSHIVRNIHRSLYAWLRGSVCHPMGPDDGVPVEALSGLLLERHKKSAEQIAASSSRGVKPSHTLQKYVTARSWKDG
jgi:hypothetical protein